MDPADARFKSLKLVAHTHPDKDPDKQLDIAKTWAAFVIGPKHVESRSQSVPKGRDDPK